jgi:cob(I)alamin adenosyltransferase
MRGLVHIYCGDGKGKTTAALGLALRACGNGYKVILVQFLKSQHTGELGTLSRIEDIEIIRSKKADKFTWNLTDDEKKALKEDNNSFFQKVVSSIEQDRKTLVIFDEIIGAINTKLIDEALVLDFLKNKPVQAEVVLTGRDPDDKLIGLADYVSEIKKIKHPFDSGISAREGIEY